MAKNNKEFIEVSKTAKFTRRSLKHFVDSRMKQGNSWDEINYLLRNVRAVTEVPEITLFNPRQDKYPNSLLIGKFYNDLGKAIIVILDSGEAPKDIISLHFKKKSDFYRLAA
jgi:Fe-S cluster assembly scaffold protein SufB